MKADLQYVFRELARHDAEPVRRADWLVDAVVIALIVAGLAWVYLR